MAGKPKAVRRKAGDDGESGGMAADAALPLLSEPPRVDADRASHTPVDADQGEKPHYLGHRDRMRRRFLESGADSLLDYELLEVLLYHAVPRRDVRPLAKQLINTFGSFWAVVTASPERLRRETKFSDATIVAISVVAAAAQRMARQQVANQPVLSNWQALMDYCHGAMALGTVEQFRLLFLDRKNKLISDEVQQTGTVDHAPVYPREVVRRALDVGATAVILVHNHPSGDPTPSRDDIALTRDLKIALGAIGVAIHDHIIIGKAGHASFKSLGLL